MAVPTWLTMAIVKSEADRVEREREDARRLQLLWADYQARTKEETNE